MVFRSTLSSLPDNPTLATPIIIVDGAIATPSEPPTDCAADKITPLSNNICAVSYCSSPNIILEFVLLPVINVPRLPINGDASGKILPKLHAIPSAILVTMPESLITKAIITIVIIPILVVIHFLTVFFALIYNISLFLPPI